jgi:purine-binding chemotaxis protein CheW
MRQFATFYIEDYCFGIDVLLIREINKQLDITHVDLAPEYVAGLLNLRGQIITVLDMGIRLGFKNRTVHSSSRCIVLKTNGEISIYEGDGAGKTAKDSVGILVDRIGDMVMIDGKDIAAPPANLERIDGRYIEGVARMEKELMVIVRTEALLEMEQKALD